MTFVLRELSCHALEVYRLRLRQDGGAGKLKVHCYRALLERLLQGRDPGMRHCGLSTVQRAETIPFADYARRATARVKLDKAGKEALALEWTDQELVPRQYHFYICHSPFYLRPQADRSCNAGSC